MISNMQLDDVLAILGRVGTVTLRKGTNDVSATPGHRANTKGWTCEIGLAGYNNSGHTRASVDAKGETARDAAVACLEALERYLGGPKGRADRARYVSSWETMVARSGPCPPNVPAYSWQRMKHPGPMHPEAVINYGD